MRYTQLTQEQRYQISALLKAGHSQTEIAIILGRHKSTISCEIRRNTGLQGYRPIQAQRLTDERRQAKNKARISDDTWIARPAIMGKVLNIVYRCLATHLIKKASYTRKVAQTGAVTLIQRFGSALNLNIHYHMLFLDGVYAERAEGKLRFYPTKAPSDVELNRLTHTLAHRIGGYLER